MDILVRYSQEEIDTINNLLEDNGYFPSLEIARHYRENVSLMEKRGMFSIFNMQIGESGYITEWAFIKENSGDYRFGTFTFASKESGGTMQVPIKRVKSGFVIQWIDPEQ